MKTVTLSSSVAPSLSQAVQVSDVTHAPSGSAAQSISSGGGHSPRAIHAKHADSARPSKKRRKAVNALISISELPSSASPIEGGSGQAVAVSHNHGADPFLVHQIRAAHRRRQDLIMLTGNITRQIKSIELRILTAHFRDTLKGIDEAEVLKLVEKTKEPPPQIQETIAFATLSHQLALDSVKPHKSQADIDLGKLAKQLPVFKSFVEGVNGFGAIGLGQIIGECGDFSDYANPAKIWKRMGLGLVNGERQRKSKDKDMAIAMGYSPTRRSIMFVIGDSLLKKQNPYRELYLARKVLEQSKLPESTKMHWHRRAQRYVEKRLLRDLWRAWRDLVPDVNPVPFVASPPIH